jgi:cytoskeletal protein CcmA (bactofilin family)
MGGEDKLREYEKKLAETSKTQAQHISGSGSVRVEGIGDISISGSGSVSPDEINISGTGRIPGGLRTRRVICAGSVTVAGDVEAEEMRLSGSTIVQGSISTEALEASGRLAIDGGLKGSSMEIAGSFKVGKSIELDNVLHVHGFLKVSEDVNVEKLVKLRGGFDVSGRVVTGNFEAGLGSMQSYVKKGIEAVNVDIRKRAHRGLILFGFPVPSRIFREGRLYTTDIVAKEKVYLENTTCDNVHGKVVILGEGCEVSGKVQYSESVSAHPRAKLVNTPEKPDVQ